MLLLACQLISQCANVTEELRFWFALNCLEGYLQCFGVAVVVHVQIPISVLSHNVTTREFLDDNQQWTVFSFQGNLAPNVENGGNR